MLSENEIDLMEHALGLEEAQRKRGYHYHRHGKFYLKSYRNYFQEQIGKRYYNTWESLCKKNFAVSKETYNNCIYYFVSDKGIKQLQQQCGYIIKFI